MESIGNGETGSVPAGQLDEAGRYLLLLRWVLIIAIAYVVIFSRPLEEIPPATAAFIALYLGSNLGLANLLRSGVKRAALDWSVVVVDIVAVAVALSLAGEGNGELFVLYFVVLFLSALADGVLLAVVAALFIAAAHLYTASGFVDAAALIHDGYIVRVPFLFAVALFFGHLVQTARAQQREAQGAMLRAQRMELLSTVSHDLRNPLGVIDSLTGLLLDGDAGRLNGDQQTLLQRIRVSIRQVLNLSNNLIDAERIELDNLALRLESCDLRGLIEETLVIAEVAAGLKGVSLAVEMPPSPVIATVDPVQIERAVSNILGNAVKFTPAGGSVRLSMNQENGFVRLAVLDSGPGFSEDLLRKLGRKYQLDASLKGTGSGLGLFIAATAARTHGGRLLAVNRSDGGARVTIEITARHAEECASEVIADRVSESLVGVG